MSFEIFDWLSFNSDYYWKWIECCARVRLCMQKNFDIEMYRTEYQIIIVHTAKYIKKKVKPNNSAFGVY